MLELYQAEWCPSSRRVRLRLTELGVDFVARQVPVQRDDRVALHEATGAETIPVLVTEGGAPIAGEWEIQRYLDARFEETPEGEAHRRKAQEMRERERERLAL